MSDVLVSKVDNIFKSVDNTWIKRSRKLNTNTIFSVLAQSAITKSGIQRIVQSEYTTAAFCKARQKLPENVFYDINKQIIDDTTQLSRVFAVDGSKFYVPTGFRSYDFKSRTNGVDVPRKAKRPIAMLSAVVDVYQDVCYDYVVSKHFNERLCVHEHLKHLLPGDTLIFDRGYFSTNLFNTLCSNNVNSIFRLKSDQFKAVSAFRVSRCTDKVVTTVVSKQPIQIRLIKYFIEGKPFIIGTSCLSKSKNSIAKLYQKRWRVELSFRRFKSNFNLNYTFCIKEQNWPQTVQCRILADTISILCGKGGTINVLAKFDCFLKYLKIKNANLNFNSLKDLFINVFMLSWMPMVYCDYGTKNISRQNQSQSVHQLLLVRYQV
jgi:hypothetical protein